MGNREWRRKLVLTSSRLRRILHFSNIFLGAMTTTVLATAVAAFGLRSAPTGSKSRIVRAHRGVYLHERKRHQSSGSCFAIRSSEAGDTGDCEKAEARDEAIRALEAKIAGLAGREINVNSPKQVSAAVFGRAQSASRDVLERASRGLLREVSPSQRQIAALVLRHRDLCRGPASVARTGTAETRHASTASSVNGLGVESIRKVDDADKTNQDDVERPTTQLSWGDQVSSQHESSVRRLFEVKGCRIHSYWKEPLLELTRPAARSLVAQLDAAQCPMGFDPLANPSKALVDYQSSDFFMTDGSSPILSAATTTAGKKGSFLAYCRDQKVKYPDAIILTRCGDFYETYGVDAVMLVEHCGLNPMAGKAKAGCPIRNVQATLDCLTSKGFRVAVYEEGADTDSSKGPGAPASSKSRIKNRFLSQIVSPASPTYLYDLVLLSNADSLLNAAQARPYVGIMSLSSGYSLVEINLEERTVRVSERLTPEAVACRLTAFPPADPLFYVPSPKEYEVNRGAYSLPFLPSSNRRDSTQRLRVRTILPSLVEQPRTGLCEIDRVKNTFLSALLKLTECGHDDVVATRRATMASFAVVSSATTSVDETYTHPLYFETAMQLGLMEDRSIPSLVSYLVPDSAPAATRRFIRRYLLAPPPPLVSRSMSRLVKHFTQADHSLPPLSVPPVGKVLSLLRAGQASYHVYRELLTAIDATVTILDMFGRDSVVMSSLMTLLEYETGMAADVPSLKERCLLAIDAIQRVIAVDTTSYCTDRITNFGNVIPPAFFERNEAAWRGRVRPEMIESYTEVERAASKLAEASASDYWGIASLSLAIQDTLESRSPIVQDIFNNCFALRDVPSWCSESKARDFVHPRDRFGKVIRNRFTTDAVQDAMSDYVSACENAKRDVSFSLTKLSQSLHDEGHIPAIVQASHTNLILSTIVNHVAKARSMGWNQAAVVEAGAHGDEAGFFDSIWPYWMDRSTAVSNTFDISGMWILTAPNMAGKSTVLRSTAAVALLSVCGFSAPLGPKSRIRRFDHLFVRGASADVPAEQKSAFGAEMGDVSALLRCCGSKSLVFVDELGRGTSPRDGTRLAGAVLEEMARVGMSGIFATHLHDILSLPLQSIDRIQTKRMAIHEHDAAGNDLTRYSWTYRIEDGVCTDSMALLTAARFGIPHKVLERAQFFESFLGGDQLNHCQLNVSSTFYGSLSPLHVPDGLHSVQRIVEDLSGVPAISIPSSWMSPPSLQGQSCVYILQLKDPLRYYVGETDNLRKRLEQHRAKGGCWSTSVAIAVSISGGKTEARSIESRTIQELARAGFLLHSTSDGRSIRAGTPALKRMETLLD